MRTPMVTRTITSTTINALVVDLVKGVTDVRTITLPREYKDNNEIIKYCRKNIDNETVQVVKVLEVKVNEQLYGMTEQEFISLAKPINKKEAE